MAVSGLVATGVSVELDQTPILRDVSLSIASGSVTAVLGPSGSGKSTLLRAIAGLVPSVGSIGLDGQEISRLPTHQRGIGLMFQSHALFPHLSVAENIAFGLVELGVTGTEADSRVRELLDLVDLSTFGGRSVGALSGGEAQRVALARALAPRPRLLMLDEPLGSLDRRLREELTTQLSDLLRRSETTAVYVTHDQEEAAIVADQLLILEGGSAVAEGTSETLWRRPASPWLARFLGHPNVSEQAMVPVSAIRVGDGEMSGEVTSCRFVEGEWHLRVELGEPVYGLRVLSGTSSVELPAGSPAQLRIDTGAVVHF